MCRRARSWIHNVYIYDARLIEFIATLLLKFSKIKTKIFKEIEAHF
jgi:hypothetical protein